MAFTTLLNEVVTETSAVSKPRKFLSSFKAARKRKAAAAQLLDVAEALQVILSTLAKHKSSCQQQTGQNEDSKFDLPPAHANTMSLAGDNLHQSNIHVFDDAEVHGGKAMPCSETQPLEISKQGQTIGAPKNLHQIEQTPVTLDDRPMSVCPPLEHIATVENDVHETSISESCDITPVPPLHLSLVSKSMSCTHQEPTDIATPVGSSTGSSDDSECSSSFSSIPPKSPCQQRVRRPGIDKGWDVARTTHIKLSSNSRQDGLRCSAILENEPMTFVNTAASIPFQVNRHDSRAAAACLHQQKSARENDGFFTARSHFSPPRSISLQGSRSSCAMHAGGCKSSTRSGAVVQFCQGWQPAQPFGLPCSFMDFEAMLAVLVELVLC